MKPLTYIRDRHGRHKRLLQNFSYLSLLQGFNMIAPLLTYPYLVRILQKEVYGLVIFISTVVSYFSILINFGFQVSATKKIAENRQRAQQLNEVVASVISGKMLLLLLSAIIFTIIVLAVPRFSDHMLLCFLSLTVCLNDVLLPAWFFQGVEDMKYVTLVNVTGRIISILFIFLLINDSGDYLLVPVITFTGGLVGAVFGLYVMYAKYNIRFRRQPFYRVMFYLRESLPIFATNITAVIKDRTNIIFIGFFLGNKSVAYYDLASKIVNVSLGVFFNISTVIFPNVSLSKDDAFFRKVMKLTFLVSIAVYIVLYFSSYHMVWLFGGKQLLPAAPVLQILGVMVILSPLSSLVGMPLLINGRYRDFYRSSLYTTGFYLLAVALLYLFNRIDMINVAIILVITILFEVINRYWFCARAGYRHWIYK
jgi:PST family polysaccharide transporter